MGFRSFSGSQVVNGNQTVNGNLTVTGTVNGATVPVADPWLPADNILLAASGDLDAYLGTNTGALTAGTVYLAKIMIRQAITPGHVVLGIQAGGTGASTGSFVGVYSSAGTLLASSADIGASLTAAGLIPLALSSSPSLTAGSFVWAAFVVNLATTQPSLYRNGGAGTITESNGGLVAATFRYAVNGTGQTSLLASITPSSNTGTGAFPLWAGLAA
jgi:hypothetical protein